MTDFALVAVDELVSKLDKHYVFPEVADKASRHLKEWVSAGTFDEPNDFALSVSAKLLELSQDKHLCVRYRPGALENSYKLGEAFDPAHFEQIRSEKEVLNFGFHKVERLDGNIGYLDIRSFVSTEVAGDTAVAAMNFIANTYALIIDLRKNGGGVASMVDLVCGYLFRPSVHLNSFYGRNDDTVEQYWSLPYVPGKHYRDKPVYVLTSSETFSGAEEFAYNLQQRKRATIIGETTKGGAHPGEWFRFAKDFEVFIPTARAVNPVTGTNWEGSGVQPDIEIPSEESLQCAYVKALEFVAATPECAEIMRREAHEVLVSRTHNNL